MKRFNQRPLSLTLSRWERGRSDQVWFEYQYRVDKSRDRAFTASQKHQTREAEKAKRTAR